MKAFNGLFTLLAVKAPHEIDSMVMNACVSEYHYGTYISAWGPTAIFLPPPECYPEESSVNRTTYPEDTQYFWVHEASLEDSLQPVPRPSFDDIEQYLALGLVQQSEWDERSQATLSSLSSDCLHNKVLYKSSSSALLAVPPSLGYSLSTVLPVTWHIYALPPAPISLPLFNIDLTSLIPVPPSSVIPVNNILSNLKFDPLIAKIVSNISVPQMMNDARWLTGEDSMSGIMSRHSFSAGAREAADWLKTQFEETGAQCELKTFLTGFAPNVVCKYPTTTHTNATVLISAHYDSRGSFGSTRAPGGDDDGSGITGLLGIARTIERMGVTFNSNVELVAFAGEEQGLYGSWYYAKELYDENHNLTLMVQADMTGYHVMGEPMQLGLPDTIGTPEVTQLVANISALYTPELQTGITTACCSDHQSFYNYGFPSTQVFERAGPIADPMYHNSGDLTAREGYDFNQVKSIAKVQFATMLHAAGYKIS